MPFTRSSQLSYTPGQSGKYLSPPYPLMSRRPRCGPGGRAPSRRPIRDGKKTGLVHNGAVDGIESIIAQRLDDDDSVFVFPSEVAARYWHRRSLELTERRAVRDTRFLSWDRFKEECFSLTRKERPINGIGRSLFAASLLAENAARKPGEEPLLHSVVHPEFADNSGAFLKQLTRLLPQLQGLLNALAAAERAASGGALIDPDFRRDLELLSDRYGRFLSDNGLFEPSGERIDISRLVRSYYLFFPEIIEDYRTFAPWLDSPRVTVVAIPAPPTARMVRFPTAIQELRALCLDLADLLDRGERAEEIAVTAADLPRWEPYLRAEAALRGLPLDFRQGRPLSEYPAGRLFTAVGACEAEGYSLDSVKALLLDRAIPWRDGAALQELVRFGIEQQCLRPFTEGGVLRDPWRFHLERLGERRLLSLYTRLRRELSAVVGAPSFRELKGRLLAFATAHLDSSRWPEESGRVFEYCLESLTDFVDTEAALAGVRAPSSFALWRAHLDERIYVQRSTLAGIAVYPYRVAAGIGPRHHFVVGANQTATRVEWPLFPFLRDDERRRLGVVDRAFSDDFLTLYAQSGAEVRLSCSREDFVGPQLAPGWFVSQGSVLDEEETERLSLRDGFVRERAVWSGSQEAAGSFFPSQKRGVAHVAATAWVRRASDFTRSAVGDPALVKQLLGQLCDSGERIRLSPTSLEGFLVCPFAFLFERLLRVPRPREEAAFEDPLLVGTLIHQTLKALFERIGAQERSVLAGRESQHAAWIDEAIAEVFARWEAEGRLFLLPIWRDLHGRLREALVTLLALERERFAGFAVGELEESFASDGPIEGVLLEGKIDRVSYRDGQALVVDYKKHRHPSLRDIRGKEGERPASFQIPFYVHLLEKRGTPVGWAGYYDVDEGSYAPVLDAHSGGGEAGGSGRQVPLDRDEMTELRVRLEGSVAEMVARLRAGDFRTPASQKGCEACPLRSICRKRYTVR